MSTTIDTLSFTADGVQFNLTLTVAGTTGVGQIETISGTVGGETITGLNTTFDKPDNQIVSASFPQVDYAGLSFSTDNGGKYNLFADGDSIHLDSNEGNKGGEVQNLRFTDEALCYLRGTRILTPTGEVAIEDLRAGDRVVCRFGGIRPIVWIGRQSYDPRFIANNPAKLPVRIAAGALGEHLPARDLCVSPGHSMLLGDTLVLALNLVNGVTVTQPPPAPDNGNIDYFQLDLGTHDCVIVEGTWSETFADGPGLRAAFHNAAEFLALYPSYRTPDELELCAPRPLRGAALDAALRPVVAKAAQNLRPGRLEGCIDRIAGAEIDGWAWDTENPEMPVLLEVVAPDGAVLHTALACDDRADLRAAKKGNGRCAFFLILPEAVPGLRVRRAADGASLRASALCAAA